MIIVFDSITGLGKQFSESLGYLTQSVEGKVTGPCILVTRNVGLGKIPETTIRFLEQYKEHVVGVVVNGNKKYGPFYCKAGDKISKLYNIPVIRKISGSGNHEDVEYVKKFIEEFTVKSE